MSMKSDVILSLERSAIYRGQAFLTKNLNGFQRDYHSNINSVDI